ncbi:hypothetical protein [Phycicoccus avicenniae]|uniref:hypothetical protein n=1 Tax=Phycicoccus avicenniae TaxID=2828860 RepID=UPI003D27D4FA
MSVDAGGPGEERPPVLPTLRNEPRLEAHVRESLRILRDSTDDPALRRRLEDVIAGRGSLRELARTPEFTAMADARIDRAVAEYEAIPAEERDAELRRALAEAHTPPPPPEVPPERRGGTW